jgi:hypothetical protein
MQVDARVMPRVRQPRIGKAPRDLTLADHHLSLSLASFTSLDASPSLS